MMTRIILMNEWTNYLDNVQMVLLAANLAVMVVGDSHSKKLCLKRVHHTWKQSFGARRQN